VARFVSSYGVVVIGRNEGERLVRCLDSVRALAPSIVYVDSGSTDGSIAAAETRGAAVVQLDLSTAFTAARARNEGFRRLVELHPHLDYVFFVDGDCEVVYGWLETATKFLDEQPTAAAVAGFRRERYPERSIYNLLIDIEWREYPFGDVKFCGGDALMRVAAFQQVSGYRSDMICGEEPEMCVRLRAAGWRIWRLNEPMVLHDAAMYRFGQWWTRNVRGGYAFALGASLQGQSSDRHMVSESSRAWTWGLIIPLATLILALSISGWFLLLLLIYPMQVLRLASREGQLSLRESWWHSGALVIGKFPEMLGQVKFLADRLRGERSGLIEYK
jgi:GT2 family glycosyltransferase